METPVATPELEAMPLKQDRSFRIRLNGIFYDVEQKKVLDDVPLWEAHFRGGPAQYLTSLSFASLIDGQWKEILILPFRPTEQGIYIRWPAPEL